MDTIVEERRFDINCRMVMDLILEDDVRFQRKNEEWNLIRFLNALRYFF